MVGIAAQAVPHSGKNRIAAATQKLRCRSSESRTAACDQNDFVRIHRSRATSLAGLHHTDTMLYNFSDFLYAKFLPSSLRTPPGPQLPNPTATGPGLPLK